MSASGDNAQWKHAAIQRILNVTLNRDEAEQSSWSLTYLKEVAVELEEENEGKVPLLEISLVDRLLLSRLSMDPDADVMTEDAELITVLASLPSDQTSWDYLAASWIRCRQEEAGFRKLPAATVSSRQPVLNEIRQLLISYIGLVLQNPEMFPRHSKKDKLTVSPLVLVPSLLKSSSGSSNMYGSSSSSASSSSVADWVVIPADEVSPFLEDLIARFGNGDEDELGAILGPALQEITRRVKDGDSEDPSASSSSGTSAPATTAGGQAGPASVVQLRQRMAEALRTRNFAAMTQILQEQQAGTGAGPGTGGDQARQALAALLGGAGPGGAGGLFQPPKEGMTLAGLDWRVHSNAIAEVVAHKALAATITKVESFNPPDATAPAFERESLLGPLLRLSAFTPSYPSLTRQFFAIPKGRPRAEIENNLVTVRGSLDLVYTINFQIFNSLVRAGPESRERVLDYWAKACRLNVKRGAMRVQPHLVSSDGFMVNLFELLLRFAEPFMDARYSKIDRVDPEYLRIQKRFGISELTRLRATEQEAKEWTESAAPPSTAPNFITEVFYIAVRLANLGLGKAVRAYDDREKELGRFKQRLQEYEADRPRWQGTRQAPEFEAAIKRATAEIESGREELLASTAQLCNPSLTERVVTFLSFVMTWLVRIADPQGKHPAEKVSLPLPQEVPKRFAMLPEHIFEDVVDILLFLGRTVPNCLTQSAKDDLVTFSVTFLSSGWYIKNPFLKAKLAEIIFYNVMPYGHLSTGALGETINYHPLALRHLVPAMMSFWVEAESTGSHTQFYDKFNIRYHLSQIFKVIWSNPQHKQRIHEEARGRESDFVIFINRLMNDVTFLLDDALEKLQELHNKQVTMDDEAAMAALDEEQRNDIASRVNALEGQIRNDFAFGHEFMRLLVDFTSETKDAFMTPEIVDRLAAMLNFNLDLLAGPRTQELKVKDQKKVGFDPKQLLGQILSVYLNLSTKAEFVQAIAKDGRSYRKEIFFKAASIASRTMLKSPAEIEVLEGLVGQVEQVKQMEAEEDEDLGDIPDEFLDPLMATLMKDPVILPKSRVTIDRSTIKSHLLSDSTDPFNRAPLKIEDVIPADELKAQIQAFTAERRAAKQKAQAGASA
ncbi:Ubiquitin conjugation factor E4 [Tilletia horrida]|nr:Ubiquitin conjugation factor E4 [Tilletia horrida]